MMPYIKEVFISYSSDPKTGLAPVAKTKCIHIKDKSIVFTMFIIFCDQSEDVTSGIIILLQGNAHFNNLDLITSYVR